MPRETFVPSDVLRPVELFPARAGAVIEIARPMSALGIRGDVAGGGSDGQRFPVSIVLTPTKIEFFDLQPDRTASVRGIEVLDARIEIDRASRFEFRNFAPEEGDIALGDHSMAIFAVKVGDQFRRDAIPIFVTEGVDHNAWVGFSHWRIVRGDHESAEILFERERDGGTA